MEGEIQERKDSGKKVCRKGRGKKGSRIGRIQERDIQERKDTGPKMNQFDFIGLKQINLSSKHGQPFFA